MEAATTNRHLGFEPPPDKSGMLGYGSYEAVVDTLEQAVSATPYLCGERFSAADVYLGSQIGWGMIMGSLEARGAFSDYWARISGRDAYRRADALDGPVSG